MIDLHLHLDGSLSAETVIKLAAEQNYPLQANDAKSLKSYLCAGKRCANVEQYLECFELPMAVLQTSEALRYAACDLVKRLDLSKMRYAEIRISPQLHTAGELGQSEVVEAVLKGLDEALEGCKYMLGAQLILCCMRGENNEEENMQTVRVAKEMLGRGVCAIDLAGAEDIYCRRNFGKIFELASSLSVPFTIHAGESSGAESVREAIEMGAKRIGHGVRICEDEEVLGLVIDKGIALELCPTSNLQNGAIAKIKQYPVQSLLKRGAIVTVNTDNMTVSDTTIKKEYAFLKKSLSLTAEEEKMLLLNAVYASFLDEEKKQKLSRIIYEQWLYG